MSEHMESQDQPVPPMPHVSSMPPVLRENFEKEIVREYGRLYSEVLSWAICEDEPGSDEELMKKLAANRELITALGGWNYVNAIMITAEYGNTSKLKTLISLLEPHKIQHAVNKKNSLGSTALHLAAREGHYETAKLLVDKGIDINIKNEYGHTALMLAIENGHIEIAKWLLEINPVGVADENRYGKSPLFVACEFAEASNGKIVEWMLTEFRDAHDFANRPLVDKVIPRVAKSGKTPGVFFVCKYKNQKHGAQLLKLMLGCAVQGKYILELHIDTCLMWAAKFNNIPVAKELLELEIAKGPDCSKKAALSCAAVAGHLEFVEYLVEYFECQHPRNGDGHNEKMKGPYEYEKSIAKDLRMSMQLAWKAGQIEVATYLMRTLWLDMSGCLRSLFKDSDIQELQKTFVQPEHSKSQIMLAKLAAKHNFHFELFLLLIPCYASPSSELNKQLPVFYKELFSQTNRDADLVFILVRLLAAIQIAAQKLPVQKLDLQLRIDAINEMLKECIASDCMDDPSTVQKMLCCAVQWRKDKRFRARTVERAQAFICGPLAVSLSHTISALFCTGHVATFVDSVFYGSLRRRRTPHGICGGAFLNPIINLLLSSVGSEVDHRKLLKSRFLYFRFCPASMFLGEALCRLWMFVVVALVALHLRSDMYELIDRTGPVAPTERMLLGLLGSNLLYEYGQMCHHTTSIFPSHRHVKTHLQQGWNQCNIVGLFLVALWAVFTFFPTGKSESARSYVALGCLATSTVLFATGLLRYLSILEPVGKLVIMIIAMVQELAAFALVFFVSCVGYCIALYCIMPQAADFSSFGGSMLTLFGSSLGNFDSSYDDTAARPPFITLTLIIVVVFVIVSNVVLLNLIIARMSAVHERIDAHSFQEWQLLRAVRTQRFLLLEESHPFCMLPPPFNLVPAVLFWIHRYVIQQQIKKLTAITIRRSSLAHQSDKKNPQQPTPKSPSSVHNRLSYHAPIVPTSPAAGDGACHDEGDGNGEREHTEEVEVEGVGPKHLTLDEQAELEDSSCALSVCGTVADVFAGLLMALVSPWIEMLSAIKTRLRNSFDSSASVRDVVFISVVFICGYLPFVVSLVYEALHTYTVVKLVLDGVDPSKCRAVQIRYKEVTKYARIKPETEGNASSKLHSASSKSSSRSSRVPTKLEKTISVRVIRTVGLDTITGAVPRNPIIRIRLGRFEAVITDWARQADNSDFWSHKKIPFPIDFRRLVTDPNYKLTFQVVDFDSCRNEELELARFSNNIGSKEAKIEDRCESSEGLNRSVSGLIRREDVGSSSNPASAPKPNDMLDSFSISECIANKKFEGKLKFDNSDAWVQVVIESQAQRTLQQLVGLRYRLGQAKEASHMNSAEIYFNSTNIPGENFTDVPCEDEDVLDVEIFDRADRRRIFSKSEVQRAREESCTSEGASGGIVQRRGHVPVASATSQSVSFEIDDTAILRAELNQQKTNNEENRKMMAQQEKKIEELEKLIDLFRDNRICPKQSTCCVLKCLLT